jgi:hypothetical protein
MMLVLTSVVQLLAPLVLKLVKDVTFFSHGFWSRQAILGMNHVREARASARPAVCLGRGVLVEDVSTVLGAAVGEFDSDI